MARDPFSDFDDAEDLPASAGEGAGDDGGEGEPEATPDVPVSRKDYEEAIRQRNEANQRHDELVRAMLLGNRGAPGESPGAAQGGAQADDFEGIFPEGADEDAVAFMKPVLERFGQRIEERVRREYAPAVETIGRRAAIDSLNSRVPGFEQEIMSEVERVYNSLPPEEKARYDSELGAEALAHKIRADKLSRAASDTSGMAHAAPFGGGSQTPSRGKTAEDVWKLPQEEFNKLLDRVKAGERIA